MDASQFRTELEIFRRELVLELRRLLHEDDHSQQRSPRNGLSLTPSSARLSPERNGDSSPRSGLVSPARTTCEARTFKPTEPFCIDKTSPKRLSAESEGVGHGDPGDYEVLSPASPATCESRRSSGAASYTSAGQRSAVSKEEVDAKLKGGGLSSLHPQVDISNLADEPYDVSSLYKTTGIFQWIARSDIFLNFTLFVIATNAVYIGLEADWNKVDNLSDAYWPFQMMEHSYCAYFTWEWIVRFMSFRETRLCLKDGWFKFDSFLVALMVIETWVVPLTFFLINPGGDSTLPIPTGPMRLMRLLRLSRMAKLLRYLPELVTMVKGMIKATRAVISSLVMVVVLIYVFAIIVHMAMQNEPTMSEDYFGTLTRCMWTLLIFGTLCDSVGPFLTQILDLNQFHSYVALTVILTFILLSAMTVMNMLIGILCEVVSGVAQAEKEEAAVKIVKEEILGMLKHFDADNSGTISKEELESVMADPHAAMVLTALNVDLRYLLELQEMVYETGDLEVGIQDVMDLMLRCRGDLNVTVRHMIHGQRFTRWSLRNSMRMLEDSVHDRVDMLQAEMDQAVKAIEVASKVAPPTAVPSKPVTAVPPVPKPALKKNHSRQAL